MFLASGSKYTSATKDVVRMMIGREHCTSFPAGSFTKHSRISVKTMDNTSASAFSIFSNKRTGLLGHFRRGSVRRPGNGNKEKRMHRHAK